jgi:hypothetical protein
VVSRVSMIQRIGWVVVDRVAFASGDDVIVGLGEQEDGFMLEEVRRDARGLGGGWMTLFELWSYCLLVFGR